MNVRSHRQKTDEKRLYFAHNRAQHRLGELLEISQQDFNLLLEQVRELTSRVHRIEGLLRVAPGPPVAPPTQVQIPSSPVTQATSSVQVPSQMPAALFPPAPPPEDKTAEEKNLALLEISNAITGQPSHRPLYKLSPPSYSCPAFNALCQGLRRVMTFEWAEFAMYDGKNDEFTTLATSGEQNFKNFEPGREIRREGNSVGWVFEHRQPRLRSDLDLGDGYLDEHQLAAAGMRAYAVAPLLNEERCTGVLRIASRNPQQYGAAEVEFLSEVAKQLSLAVENLKAYEEIASLKAKLEIENTYLQDEIRKEHNFEEILGNSPELLKLLDRVESAAPDGCQRTDHRRNGERKGAHRAGDP